MADRSARSLHFRVDLAVRVRERRHAHGVRVAARPHPLQDEAVVRRRLLAVADRRDVAPRLPHLGEDAVVPAPRPAQREQVRPQPPLLRLETPTGLSEDAALQSAERAERDGVGEGPAGHVPRQREPQEEPQQYARLKQDHADVYASACVGNDRMFRSVVKFEPQPSSAESRPKQRPRHHAPRNRAARSASARVNAR